MMFDLEFVLKQKAQLKYLQVKTAKKNTRSIKLNLLSHEFLWSPTPVYYGLAYFIYRMSRRRYGFTVVHCLPFMAIPPTMDYAKREFYVSKFPED
jgi:hypothetical protein